MSGTDAISGAELRVWLDWLGLSVGRFARLAEQFNHPVDAAEVIHWTSGARPPSWVGDLLEQFDRWTSDAVSSVVDALHDARDPGVIIYRTDAEMWAERPDMTPWPSTWWRMVVARATVEVPGVEIAYFERKNYEHPNGR